MINSISIDLEDWYHICGVDNSSWADEWESYSHRLDSNTGRILDILKKHDIKATFFVVGFIADKNPGLVKKIADQGHELASHGYFHRRVFDMTPEEFEEDLMRSKKAIEEASGQKVLGYRAPEWSLKPGNRWVLDILKKNGFEYDSSVNPLSHLSGKSFGLFPGTVETEYGKIWEIPLTSARLFGERFPFTGGLPMRIAPYWFIVRNIDILNRKGQPAMLYLHPWEFDEEHIEIDLPLSRKFMYYFNRPHTSVKLRQTLKHFRFSTVRNMMDPREDPERQKGRTWLDRDFAKSLLITWAVSLVCYAAFFSLPFLFGVYSVLGIVVVLTIIYWPWSFILKYVEAIIKR